jgi:imidazolonepropionase-like amidohydrolase
MRKLACVICISACLQNSNAQSTADSGSFLLHKFEQPIGKEKYTVSKKDGKVVYDIDFKFVDRGNPVPLKATMVMNSSMEPVSFIVKGSTSRFSYINDSVVIDQKTAHIKVDDAISTKTLSGINFPVAGYSPGTTQMLLVDYWKKHRMPESINTLPSGAVHIKKDGEETFVFNGQNISLDRYIISGLVWGNELLWIDNKGQLFCLITNDAEGDKLEMVYEPYESLLPTFIERAAKYGMQIFTKSAKPVFEKHALIAITGGNLVDVVNGQTIVNAIVIIENGKIKAAGKSNMVPVPKEAFIINAKGKTILPGLWDMHAHFEQAEWGPAYLAAGVTTVRDCGNEYGYINAIQKAIDDGQGVGPHILKAGIIDGKGKNALGIIQADTKEEAIKAVQRYKENGFAQIKIYSSVKPEIVKVICTEAHRLGLTVTGHVPRGMNIKQGVDSGMDMINHLQYVTAMLKKNAAGGIDPADSNNAPLMQFLKAHNTVIDPTLGVYELSFRYVKDDINMIEPAFATLPQPMQPLFTNMGTENEKTAQQYKMTMDIFKKTMFALYKNNVTIVAGTDMGFPGYSVARELELYVESGLTPLQSIQTATITPARAMQREKFTGSVEAGKQADLMIVDGDPLQNIRNIRKVTTVIKDGNIYNPAQLHTIAGFQ